MGHPGLHHTNSNRILSLSLAVTLVGNYQCRDLHLPVALLPTVPVQASDNLATTLLINRRWGSWNDTAGLPPDLVLLPLTAISILSTFNSMQLLLIDIQLPFLPACAMSNSIKNVRKISNHARRFAEVVHRTLLSLRLDHRQHICIQ